MKMIRWLVLMASVIVVSIGTGLGCGKREAPDPAASMSPSEVALTSGLTEQLRQYYFTKRNVPTNFDDFVTVAGLKQVPEPPAGRKFAIDRRQLQVVVVNR